MTKEQFAALLNGRQYGSEITEQEEQLAKDHNLVVVFGYSDDNMEFRGALYDEVSCYEGGEAYFYKNFDEWHFADSEAFSELKYEGFRGKSRKIEAVWYDQGYSWIYETDIPHATFEILEGEEKYCRGIVFSLNDLT